jgi:hypothetical protein
MAPKRKKEEGLLSRLQSNPYAKFSKRGSREEKMSEIWVLAHEQQYHDSPPSYPVPPLMLHERMPHEFMLHELMWLRERAAWPFPGCPSPSSDATL